MRIHNQRASSPPWTAALALALSLVLGYPTAAEASPYYDVIPDPAQNPSDTCCVLPGDVTEDGVVDIGDLTCLIGRIFCLEKGYKCCPFQCHAAGDVDGSGVFDISDLVYFIEWMFRNGDPLVCGPEL